MQTVLVAGGGTRGGTVIAASDQHGAYPAFDAQQPKNLPATIYSALGIPGTAVWKDELNRPHNIYHSDPDCRAVLIQIRPCLVLTPQH